MAHIGLDHSQTTVERSHYLRIAGDLRDRIAAGEFGRTGRLPTTRDLARRLGVHRNTIVAAYRKLEEWGVARGHVGRGTYASPPPPAEPDGSADAHKVTIARAAGSRAPRTARSTPRPAAAPWEGSFSRALDGRAIDSLSAIYSVGSMKGAISFAGSFPAAELLPIREFRKALDRVVEARPGKALAYGPAQGYLPLRRWIAADMTRRGMPTQEDEILITNGSQQAIDLIARAFTDSGDTVLLENPGYSGAISAFQSYGARISGLPLDEEGVAPGALVRPSIRSGAKLAYLTPSFQNPTSAVLSRPRREALLREAASAGLLLVEDDWAGGLRFEGEAPPTLRALDGDGRVIYLSTFAKMLIPALRVGWIAASRPVIEKLTALKQIADCCTSPLVQCGLEQFLRTGGLRRHLPRVHEAYRQRRNRMISALERDFPARSSWTRPEGGLFLWVRLPEETDAAAAAAEAAARGILVSCGDPFHVEGGGPPSLRLTFASSRPAEIDRGIRTLGSILKKQLAARGRRRARPAPESLPLV